MRLRGHGLVVRAIVTLASVGFGCSPAKTPPKVTLAPLETTRLTSLAPGPGSRWVVALRPRTLFASKLAAPIAKIVPEKGLDRLSKLVGFDVRQANDVLIVGYASANLYAAHLPDGTSPGAAVDAFELRILPPSGRASPRPDVVRAWGSTADGARASLVGLWSSKGDAVVGEAGRLGPIAATMALATGKLAPTRALSAQAPFAELARWAGDAEVAMFARCPLTELGADALGSAAPPVVATECEGAGITARSLEGGKVGIALHVTGRWGTDAEAARKELTTILERVTKSDLGKALGLETKPIVTASESAVDASIELAAATVADGLHKLVAADVSELLK